ncbi:FAD-dependent monooxygenase [Rhodococcus sp. T2V]|uniref:FAD-dependent monooxygenase n=1 Tax=Rhodococcus sp. T2V TaxID=3034164 RepID=UPI0023E0B95F|nr:FAD-dependent monooxygenase [Rhodococcus sp. T2V]MDF3312932.1 FAD-dependent monooxygenase [Rhodococcus sp. T2V]
MLHTTSTEVLVVGAGPAGLTATALLADLGVDAITVSRHSGTAPQPRATVTNQRTVEVLRDLGIEENAKRVGIPFKEQGNYVYATSFTGDEIIRYRTYGVDQRASDYLMASPCENYNIGQHRLEPVLLEGAKSKGATVRFGHDVVAIEQSSSGVTATILDRDSGEEYRIHAQYLIAADGGRSRIAEQLGIPFEGESGVMKMMSAWLEVDLTEYAAYRPGHFYFMIQPGGDSWIGSGTFLNVARWNEWVFARQFDPSQGEPDRSDEAVIEAARSLIGVPDIPVRVKDTALWEVNHTVAETYRRGRVFLAGDAAHRHPPAGGLGSNTSIQDSYNLAWKLAFVLRGWAGEALLDSYDQERQPVGRHVVERAMQNLGNMRAVGAAIGLRAGQSAEEGWAILRELWADGPVGAERREKLAAATDLQHYRTTAHGTDIGQRYTSSSAVLDDGTSWPESTRDPELYYQPTTHPGAYLPHAWVEQDRRRVSTLDLAGHGRFSLIVGIGGESWSKAAQSVAADLGIELPVFHIGYRCEYDDVAGDWTRMREIGDGGALLVRPDRHIAWRAQDRSDTPAEELAAALRDVLALTGTPEV